ncbi:hypothetical protein C0991_003460, partial [Blastosporella zonata]
MDSTPTEHETPNENDEEQEDQRSTHASRHPEKLVIPAQLNYQKTSRAERETAEVGRTLKRERKKAIQEEINRFFKMREEFTAELAKKFSLKDEKAHALVNAAVNVKRVRAPNLRNALVSRRAKELNEGRKKGDRYTMAEIQEIVQKEIENGEHKDIDDEELREELEDLRELRTKGSRSTNRAAAIDHKATLGHIEME